MRGRWPATSTRSSASWPSSAASTAPSTVAKTAIRPSPSRLTITPSCWAIAPSSAVPTSRSSSAAGSAPASSAHEENPTRSVKSSATSVVPMPRPDASDSACHTWSAPRPTSCATLPRPVCSALTPRARTCAGSSPAVDSGSPKRSSPGRRRRSQRVSSSRRGWLSARMAAGRSRASRASGCSSPNVIEQLPSRCPGDHPISDGSVARVRLRVRPRSKRPLLPSTRIMRNLRLFLAVGAIAVPAVALTACGNSVPGNSVASVDGNGITKAQFNHWMQVAAISSQGALPGQQKTAAQVPDAPNFTKCIAQKQATAPKPAKGQPKPTAAQFKAQCKQEYDGLRDQVLQFLISAQWIQGEAKDQGVKVSDADVNKQFQQTKKQSFPKEKDYQKFLKS